MSKTLLLVLAFAPWTTHLSAQKRRRAPQVSTHCFAPVKWRSIGPFRGGRSVAATGVVGDPKTYYMGTTGGGLWKTDNMGISWRNISDGLLQDRLDRRDRRGRERSERGVRRHGRARDSRRDDALTATASTAPPTPGKTWKKIGLERTRHISRIVVHPKNPDIVLVAAQGALYGPSRERGVFKSTDGGATWKNVLYVDDKTGAAELSMDADEPAHPLRRDVGARPAALEGHQRRARQRPVQVDRQRRDLGEDDRGPARGDGQDGDRGQPLESGEGLRPDRERLERGRARPVRLDQRRQELEPGHRRAAPRPAGVVLHRALRRPQEREHDLRAERARRCARTTAARRGRRCPGAHGDYHDLWINPDDPDNFIISNDGGAVDHLRRGKSWSSQSNMPTAQFYRINVDNQFPYRIYGGQQDNTSVAIASRELGAGGITDRQLDVVGRRRKRVPRVRPRQSRATCWAAATRARSKCSTRRPRPARNIMAAPIQYLGMDAKDMKYRYNWNAPIIWSRHEPNTFYHGAQVLLKTSDMGKTWTEVVARPHAQREGEAGHAGRARTPTRPSAPRTTARWPTSSSRRTRRA